MSSREAGRAAAPGRLSLARVEAFRRLALERALAEIAASLDLHRIPFLVFKGPVFERWLYDDPRQRPYGDLDLLLPAAETEAAAARLAGLGFELGAPHNTSDIERSIYHDLWIRPGQLAIEVELHRRIPEFAADPELVWRRLFGQRRSMDIQGASVAVPPPAACALLVAMHASWHEASTWRTPAGRPQPPLRDLGQAIARVDRDTWRAAAALADELGATAALTRGLLLDPGGGPLIASLRER